MPAGAAGSTDGQRTTSYNGWTLVSPGLRFMTDTLAGKHGQGSSIHHYSQPPACDARCRRLQGRSRSRRQRAAERHARHDAYHQARCRSAKRLRKACQTHQAISPSSTPSRLASMSSKLNWRLGCRRCCSHSNNGASKNNSPQNNHAETRGNANRLLNATAPNANKCKNLSDCSNKSGGDSGRNRP